MLTPLKVKNILSKIAKAARVEDVILIDDVKFRLRVLSKEEADTIDARRADNLENLGAPGDDISVHLAEYVSMLKMDTLAYAIIGVDDDSLDIPSIELEDGHKIGKYEFMTVHFLPSLVSSVFDKLYDFYIEGIFKIADERAGVEVRIQTTDTETEIQILKDRLDLLERDRKASQPDKGSVEGDAPPVSRDEARDLVFKPIVKEDLPTRAPAPAHPPAPAPVQEGAQGATLEEDPAKTILAARALDQYNQSELDESERLFLERENRRKAFNQSEPTTRQPLPPDNDSYILEPMPRPRLTPQNLNQPPRGSVNPNFKGPKP